MWDRWMAFRNDAGEVVPAFGVLRVTGVALRGLTPVLTVEKPNEVLQRSYWLNGPMQVAAGGFGLCTCEVAYALFNSGTPSVGEGWGAVPGEWTLSKNAVDSFEILGDAAEGLVLVKPMEVTQLIGKLDGALSVGGSATVSVWAGAGGSESDSTMNVTAFDWLMKAGAAAVASGKKVKLEWVNGQWYVTNAECA